MPIGGRINRRDHLRSKVTSSKTKAKADNKSSKDVVHLKKFKETKFSKSSQSKVTSESSMSAPGDAYVSLEDIMFEKDEDDKKYKHTEAKNMVIISKRSRKPKLMNLQKNASIIDTDVMVIDGTLQAINKSNISKIKSKTRQVTKELKAKGISKINDIEPSTILSVKISPKQKLMTTEAKSSYFRKRPDNVVLKASLTKNVQNKAVKIIKSKGKTNKGRKVVSVTEKFNETIESDDLIDKEETVGKRIVRTTTNVVDFNRPFVVEADSVDETLIVCKEQEKIPGLVLLENLKNKKSGISHQSMDSHLKIPGLENTADTKRRKSQIALESMVMDDNPKSNIRDKKSVQKSEKERKTNVESASKLRSPIKDKTIEHTTPTKNITSIRQRKPALKKSDETTEMGSNIGSRGTKMDESKIVSETEYITRKGASPTKSKSKTSSEGMAGLDIIPEKRVRKSAMEVMNRLTLNENVDRKTDDIQLFSKTHIMLRKRESPIKNILTTSINSLSTEDYSPNIRKRKSAVESLGMVSSAECLSGTNQSLEDITTKKLSRTKKIVTDSQEIPDFPLIDEIRSRRAVLSTPKRLGSPLVRDEKLCKYTPLIQSRASLTSFSSTVSSQAHYPASLLTSKHLSSATSLLTPGVLTRPSPYKRPLSCLSGDFEAKTTIESEPKQKMTRIDETLSTPSRQGVTFNNRVEVKQIKGTSFNSSSGAVDNSEGDVSDLDELKRRVKEKIEQTKRELIKKRLAASDSGRPVPETRRTIMASSTAAAGRHGACNKTDSVSEVVGDGLETSATLNFTNPSSSALNRDLRANLRSVKQSGSSVVLETDTCDKSHDSMMSSSDASDDGSDGRQTPTKKDRCTIL